MLIFTRGDVETHGISVREYLIRLDEAVVSLESEIENVPNEVLSGRAINNQQSTNQQSNT